MAAAQWTVGGREREAARTSDELVFIYDAAGNYVAQWVPATYADLIAAAPELLAALEEMQRDYCDTMCADLPDADHMHECEKARAAIARALIADTEETK